MIREMIESDMPYALSFLKRCFNDSNFDAIGDSFDYKSCSDFLLFNIRSTASIVLLYEENNIVMGMIAFVVYPSYMDKNNLKAIEFIWHSDPELKPYKKAIIFVKLLKAADIQLKGSGARSIIIGVSPDNAAGKLLDRMGYKMVTHDYVKVL